MEERFGSVVFRCNFDSGNFGAVHKIERSSNSDDDVLEFKVWTRPDCAGTPCENGNRTWFHFSVGGVPIHKTLKITMCHLNKQSKLYSQGMTPVFKTVPGKSKWDRIRDRPTYEMIDGQFHLTFLHTIVESRCITYFAFVYPYSYSDLQKKLDSLKIKHSCEQWCQPSWSVTASHPKEAIYYHETTLCYSINKLKVQLLTITSPDGMCNEREHQLKDLFPDGPTSLPRRFRGKKVYFISARVHPGEVPASFVLNGFLNFILRPNDPRAIMLRQMFVFKIIPMLNPDGVFCGHYRTDSRGVNLNRYYTNPSPLMHPSIYGAKAILLYHHRGGDVCKCGADTKVKIVRDETKPAKPKDTVPDNINNQVQSILNNLRKEIQCDDVDFQSKMAARVNEICNKMAQLHTPDTEPEQGVTLRTTSKPAPAEYSQNIEVRACVCGKVPEPLPCNKDYVTENPVHVPSGVELYIDLHGHASKRGCFIYGNNLQDERQVENMIYPRLIAYNSTHFDFAACCFTERNMYAKDKNDGLSKEGSGRVGMYKGTNIIHSYTLECNYNMGRQLNMIPAATKDPAGRCTPPPQMSSFPPKYTTDSWEEVGRALAVSVLDLHNCNPWSRLANTDVINVHGLRALISRTSRGAAVTGPGVLRRLAYATSKVNNTPPAHPRSRTSRSQPPEPQPKSKSRSQWERSVRRVTNKAQPDSTSEKTSSSKVTEKGSDKMTSHKATDISEKSAEKAGERSGERSAEASEGSESLIKQESLTTTDSSSSKENFQKSGEHKKKVKSTLLRQTSASLAKRSIKVKKNSATDIRNSPTSSYNEDDLPDELREIIKPTDLTVQYRSIYSGVYKLDMSDDNGSRIKRIYPSNTAPKPAPTALCNFVDLFDSSNSSGGLSKQSEVITTNSYQDYARQGREAAVKEREESPVTRKPKKVTSCYPALKNGRVDKKRGGKSCVKGWATVLKEWHGVSGMSGTTEQGLRTLEDSQPSDEQTQPTES